VSAGPPDPTSGLAAAGDRLLEWWSARRRDLPWRASRDPWAILVSEVMAQQTQVARVAPRWIEFLQRWPTPSACAASPSSEVVAAWIGLGYNRRALNLWRAAGVVVERHGGALPDRLDELLELPGVGPYTARAILAFAFEADVGVVDTNIARVLARWSGRRLSRAEVQALADRSVPSGLGWSWNQALMDLGATLCTASAPSCADCPLADRCAWALGRAVGSPGDPAVGSAGVAGRQSRFAGSDRQGRGRLVAALASGPLAFEAAAATMGWPGDGARAERVLAGLVRDGLVVLDDGVARLA